MSWLKKVFGSGTSPGGGDGGVVDLRSNEKRRMARDAARGLARAMRLQRVAFADWRASPGNWGLQVQRNDANRRTVGREGGHALMQQVCYRVKALGGSYTYVSTAWNGVGEWRD
jgi:hypothetical protein